MKNTINIFLFLTINCFGFGASLNAQNNIQDEKNGLIEKREVLLGEKTDLLNEIANLKAELLKLDEILKIEIPKYFKRKYGNEDGARVAMGQIWKGMTEAMMRDSWGEPDKTNTDRFSYGVFTQFYYGKVIYFFRDGKLIDWEEEK